MVWKRVTITTKLNLKFRVYKGLLNQTLHDVTTFASLKPFQIQTHDPQFLAHSVYVIKKLKIKLRK